MSGKDLSKNESEVKIDKELSPKDDNNSVKWERHLNRRRQQRLTKQGLSSENNNSLVNKSDEVISEIPEVERRLKALKKLHFEKLKVDEEFKKRVLQLRHSEFHSKYERIFKKRAKILCGCHRPTDEECHFSEDNDSDSYIEESVDDQNVVDGIQDFWLVSLLSFPLIRNWITEEDELVLKHLKNIKAFYNEKPPKLVIEFIFRRNEFFTNKVLRKEYEIGFGSDPNSDHLFSWNDIYPIKRKGCLIDWKESTRFGKIRKIIQEYKKDSYSRKYYSCFDFFSPLEEEKEFNEDIREQLIADWKIALIIYEKLVPNAVSYYIGAFIDEDYSDSYDPFLDDEEEDD